MFRKADFQKSPVDSLMESRREQSNTDNYVDPAESDRGYTTLLMFMGLAAVLLFLVYFIFKFYKHYKFAKDVEPVINILNVNPTVGETITCRIRFRQRGGNIIPSATQHFRSLHINAEIAVDCIEQTQAVAVTKAVSTLSSHVLGKFSIRKAGKYLITVTWKGFTLSSPEPFMFEVCPGPPFYQSIDFETHNAQILCVTTGIPQYFKVSVADQYLNKCPTKDVNLDELTFQLSHIGNPLSVDQEFCLYDESNSEDSASDICLKITVHESGIYPCVLKYNNTEILGNHLRGQKLLISLTPSEEVELRSAFTRHHFPGAMMVSCPCKVATFEDHAKVKMAFTGISSYQVAFAKFSLALSWYPDNVFPINAKTRILLHRSTHLNSEVESIAFIIRDGIRPSLLLDMEPENARKFLAAFAHSQGFTLSSVDASFQEKKSALRRCLSSNFFSGVWATGERTVQVQYGNLVGSTLKEMPKQSDEWLVPFVIKYNEVQVPHITKPAVPPVTKWLNELCEEFFMKSEQNGIFQRMPGSKLLHPVSSTVTRKPLEVYRLAGQIVGKAIVEVILRRICTNTSNVRFTRSFLSYILGHPVEYSHLETDEPRYFQRIKEILLTDVSDKGYTFTAIPSSSASEPNVTNLITDGSNQLVTNENKEYYLNLLAYRKLIYEIEPEIKAFRDGFHDVIAQDKLAAFHEDDLQMLISGGCEFRIKDLKEHHRVVNEMDNNGYASTHQTDKRDKKKILDWFWTAAYNMTEKEHSQLIFFSTGSYSLPSCGLGDLNPIFTINLTGSFNQPPRGNPLRNEIILGDHASFDSFERSLLYAIKPESEKILMALQQESMIGMPQDEQDELLTIDSAGAQFQAEDEAQQSHESTIWDFAWEQIRGFTDSGNA